jgi:hypothetical protein
MLRVMEMSSAPAVPDRIAVERFLGAVYRCAPPGAWVEVRFRLGRAMGQAFHPVADLGTVAETVLARGAVTDVFVGVVPCSRRGGGGRADLIGRSRVVWVDCDDAASAVTVEEFHPPPSMVIASGTAERRHPYWLLREAIDLDRMKSINRRLGAALGADERSADAARILRPAGSLNRKRCPPTAVRLLRLELRCCVPIGELQAMLPPGEPDWSVSPRMREIDVATSDPLRAISPRVYVARLTGHRVGRSGKIRCPLHDDRTPSLHVYQDPERAKTGRSSQGRGGYPRTGRPLGRLAGARAARGRITTPAGGKKIDSCFSSQRTR